MPPKFHDPTKKINKNAMNRILKKLTIIIFDTPLIFFLKVCSKPKIINNDIPKYAGRKSSQNL